MLSKIVQSLKNLVSTNKRRGSRGMPYQYLATTWNEGARKFGVGGARNKIIRRVRGQTPTDYWPYNPHIAQAFENVSNTPEWDETGGQSQPQADFLGYFDPGLIAYDQSRLRRK